MLFYLSEKIHKFAYYQPGVERKKKKFNKKSPSILMGKKPLQHLRLKKRKTPKINVENMASIKKCPQKMKLIEDTSQEDLNYKNKLTAK